VLAPPPGDDDMASAHDHWQIGRFSSGKITGSGMMRTADGSYYFGDFKEGKRHGAGMCVSESGTTYEGEFFNDMKDGCGCMWSRSGPAYFGEWHLDKRHGSGMTGTSNPALLIHMDSSEEPLLPNSQVTTAIQFETFVVITKNHVRGSTTKMIRNDHELMVEAILWNSTQSRTTACEGWNVGIGCVSRLSEFVKGIDARVVPEIAHLELAQRFDEHGTALYQIPKIPLWVMVQPAYACISPSIRSPLVSPKALSASSLRGGKSKMPAVRFLGK